jgi:hypothetical protein
MRQSKNRTPRMAMAIYLMKMRLGLSNSVLAVLFHLKDKRIIAHIINQVRNALKKSFVSNNLGFQHIDRQTAINEHQSAIATTLLTNKPNQMILVADATYLRCEKSSNNELQRATYSLHKHYHLVKPMVLTTTVIFSLFAVALASNSAVNFRSIVIDSNRKDRCIFRMVISSQFLVRFSQIALTMMHLFSNTVFSIMSKIFKTGLKMMISYYSIEE